jgi:hypothetical protein
VSDDREVFKVRRDAGLAKRHETREARAIRRQVAEEIAQAIEAMPKFRRPNDQRAYVLQAAAARIAREIGSKEAT